MDLSLDRWNKVTPTERNDIANTLARHLPSGFSFFGTHPFELCEQKNDVALYRHNNCTFALIPGAEVTLGYDTDRPWTPRPDESESWKSTAERLGLSKSITQYIAGATLRPRRVSLPPLLIETKPWELGWDTIDADDPEVKRIAIKHAKHRQVTVNGGDATLRIARQDDGSIIAERSMPRTHSQMISLLSAQGFRFPTSDEWEYACGGSYPTLFRWGDHVPCDRYPTDVSPAEAAWRRARLKSPKLAPPEEGFTSDWEYHRRPNVFGLSIAYNPYQYELVSEIGISRGGDGGRAICGGCGFFVGWLTLATAYFEDHSCTHDPSEPISPGYSLGRRVLDLS